MAETVNREITLKELAVKLTEWLSYLKSKWLIIVFGCAVGVGLGYFYASYKKPKYVAVSTFALEDASGGSGLGQMAGLASMVGIDIGAGGTGGVFQGDNLIELYKSRTMVQKALLTEMDFQGKKQLILERYLDFNNLKQKWSSELALNRVDFQSGKDLHLTRTQDSIIGEVVKAIGINNLVVTKPDKKLSILKVQVTSKDELFSKAFNDQIVKNVNEFYVSTKTKKSMQNIAVLQHQTDSVKRELNRALSGMASLTDANPNANPARQILKVPSQKKQVDAQANTAILTELVKNLEMSKLSQQKEMPLIQMIDAPVFPLNKISTTKIQGMVAGFFIACFLMSVFLLVRRGFLSMIR
ncbi:lipopolysaccharide biosynthesis protein [Pedobacter agri]|uniref:lipopolysaccharide biosynthesis protein n=1 Tax=Pedobacter agri TaxID=454586 RepID=UPI00292DBE6A|nr:lipopolysaccharide biosynthesis protein [Pedobacter agri]